MDTTNCGKCGGTMVRGYVLDHTQGSYLVPVWYAGAARKAFFTGVKRPPEKGIPIGMMRCEDCGYLELFARREFRELKRGSLWKTMSDPTKENPELLKPVKSKGKPAQGTPAHEEKKAETDPTEHPPLPRSEKSTRGW